MVVKLVVRQGGGLAEPTVVVKAHKKVGKKVVLMGKTLVDYLVVDIKFCK